MAGCREVREAHEVLSSLCRASWYSVSSIELVKGGEDWTAPMVLAATVEIFE